VVNSLRRSCQKPARLDAYPPLKCFRGATVFDTFSLPARLSGDTLSYCFAIVSPTRNQRVTLGTTADDRLHHLECRHCIRKFRLFHHRQHQKGANIVVRISNCVGLVSARGRTDLLDVGVVVSFGRCELLQPVSPVSLDRLLFVRERVDGASDILASVPPVSAAAATLWTRAAAARCDRGAVT